MRHKNVIVSAIIALGIIVVGFSFTHQRVGTSVEQVRGTQTLSTAEVAPDIDTDRDGLSDWKEKLYGSDINDSDTDHDGTKDGDEVLARRNPIVSNTAKDGDPPNDKLAYLEDPSFATSSTDMAGLKKEFFAKYLAEGSRNIKETTFRDLIKRVDTKQFKPREEIINLNISSDNSAEGIKAYVNAFGVVIKRYLVNSVGRSEDAIIKDALTKKDSATIADLQLLAAIYKNFADDLIPLSVPSTLAKAHLLIVNGYAGMGHGLMSLENIQKDPVNGTAGYEAYVKYRLDVTSGYAMIVAYVARQHIGFAADEPGYPFYWNTAAAKAPTNVVSQHSTTGPTIK